MHIERFSCQKNDSNCKNFCKDLIGVRADTEIAAIPVWP